MKDYLMELAKLSGKCLVVFIFALVFFSTVEPDINVSNDVYGSLTVYD